MVQKADIESPDPPEKGLKGRKKPLVSCDKYDEEERKALIEEEKKEEEAKIEPIHPSEERGGKKKGLLKTCK